MNKKTLKDINFENKKVIVRLDFNVPIENNKITDDTRIKAALETIKYLQNHNAKIIMLSHLGRIKTEADKKTRSLSLVAKKLQELINHPVIFINETRGKNLETAVNKLKAKDLLLIENTRFEDLNGKKESKNDPELGKYWASLGEVFVNDAFGTAHRAHASNVGIATYIKDSCIGFLIEKELTMLNKVVINPERPFVAILGGAKVSDKIDVIKQLLTKADSVLIGGGMAYTFMKALGYKIGKSLVENDKVDLAKELINLGKDKLVLPVDYIAAPEFKDIKGTNTTDQNIADNLMGLDIGTKTEKLFQDKLKSAKTIVWNGPMGVFEMNNFAHGTKAICEAIANLKSAFSLIGGGDSAAAVTKFHYEKKVSFISTGGGASLEYLEGKDLPGITAIKNKN
ncbi:Phosphoglycerate kinase [Spiroplasma sp. JKS002669]|uniref:phosphoglycerate kinase n=1 Tax=Spiroplasma attinicola TaxID=2904537 RepID=UPI002022CC41|nr:MULTISPECIES: phosphoglycerate kinase [unclassified Spiroplasma]MCL6428702.1 Phosphoglycerate kinase [Spiroplasma sp. JKS002669]MCL8210061.1 Phosphoglycerate kinase [Spiroplasma sp. JKS002670]